MDAITGFLEDFDFAKILPEIGTFLSSLRFWICFLILLGPLVLLGLGLWYFFRPVKEANNSLGFRVYFGMGSVQAWRFAQRLAGMVWGGLGAVLTVVMLIVCIICAGMDMIVLATTAVICLAIEALLVLAGYIVMQIMITSRFDKDGNPRPPKE